MKMNKNDDVLQSCPLRIKFLRKERYRHKEGINKTKFFYFVNKDISKEWDVFYDRTGIGQDRQNLILKLESSKLEAQNRTFD